jgi:hypothetical protein
MKTPDHVPLLHDVLHNDPGYAAFRAEVRTTMLAEVRRRRAFRRARPFLMMAACLTLAVTLLGLFQTRHTGAPESASSLMVRSVPLRPEQIVRTAGHTPNMVTVRSGEIELMTASLDVVRTVGDLPAAALTDEQLLELFKGRAVALVTLTTGKKLVFLDQESQPDSVHP